jgi:hypothetical protein
MCAGAYTTFASGLLLRAARRSKSLPGKGQRGNKPQAAARQLEAIADRNAVEMKETPTANADNVDGQTLEVIGINERTKQKAKRQMRSKMKNDHNQKFKVNKRITHPCHSRPEQPKGNGINAVDCWRSKHSQKPMQALEMSQCSKSFYAVVFWRVGLNDTCGRL